MREASTFLDSELDNTNPCNPCQKTHQRPPLPMDEEAVIRKGVQALIKELGPVEALRFMNLPKKKRLESVRRHREWQKFLDKNGFFN